MKHKPRNWATVENALHAHIDCVSVGTGPDRLVWAPDQHAGQFDWLQVAPHEITVVETKAPSGPGWPTIGDRFREALSAMAGGIGMIVILPASVSGHGSENLALEHDWDAISRDFSRAMSGAVIGKTRERRREKGAR